MKTEELAEFRDWLIDQELSENTVNSYCVAMRQYFNAFDLVSKENGVKWKNALLQSGVAPATVNLRICGFNAFCKFKKLSISVKRVKIQQRNSVENVISKADYERLLEGLRQDSNLLWYWNIRLLASTGARVSEFIQLTKSDFDRGYAELWTKGKIRRVYIPQAFRDAAGEVYIPQAFRDAAGEWFSQLELDDKLAQGRNGSLTSRGVSQALKTFAARYDVDPKVMHPHSFRHLFAIEFLKRNSNISLLADVMGHTSVATTAIYTRMTREQQEAAVNDAVRW